MVPKRGWCESSRDTYQPSRFEPDREALTSELATGSDAENAP